jgi:hypothetical protein
MIGMSAGAIVDRSANFFRHIIQPPIFLVELIGGRPSGFEAFVLRLRTRFTPCRSAGTTNRHRGVSMVDLNQNYGAFVTIAFRIFPRLCAPGSTIAASASMRALENLSDTSGRELFKIATCEKPNIPGEKAIVCSSEQPVAWLSATIPESRSQRVPAMTLQGISATIANRIADQ